MLSTPPTLLQQLQQAPDAATWARFVQLYTPLLRHWAKRAGLQDSDAADLVQEVLLNLIRKIGQFSYGRGDSFRAWLFTLTLNQVRTHQKRLNRQPIADGDQAADALADSNPLGQLEEAEYRQHVVTRALQLAQKDFQTQTWQAFWQHVMEERSAAEVAAELGTTPGAVYSARLRVLGRLRQELAGLLD